MNDERRSEENRAIPGVVHWDLGMNTTHATGDTLWRCDAVRAGRLYNRSLFATQQQAEEFARKMRDAEPDQMFSVEAIKASTVWN